MKEFLKKDSFILASLPILSFVVALIFEMGYADAFGYDYYFIEVNLKVMVVALVCVIIVLLPLLIFLYAFLYLLKVDSKKTRAAALALMYPVFSMFGFYITGFQSNVIKLLLSCSLLYLAWTLAKLFFKARSKGWEQALEDYADSEGVQERSKVDGPIKSMTFKDYLYMWAAVLVFILSILFMIRGIGYGVAHWKTSYSTVMLDGEEYALVAAYGDNFVAAGVFEDRYNYKISIIPKDSEALKEIKSARFADFISLGLWLR
ncbi:hypothetical protein C4J95_2893 [Pseudomonas orientalis]|uniref:hypothetical protein n=1 Tax=Pseudomonas orientalis TaxID=76758 RepID=UPI000F587F35|nr:hypothetical protein [Pseudomonas orientalis]AZF00354.1 hypothetical protein C4J95_2893 [Pseudomonas orientalis]